MYLKKHCAAAFAAALISVLIAVAPQSAAALVDPSSANNPTAVVKTGISDVIAVFENKQMPLKERREKLEELGLRYFDFNDMARSALGYHWRDLTQQQRSEFIPLFANFIQAAYLSKLHESAVRRVREEAMTADVRFTRETFDGPAYAEVDSNVVLHDQKDPLHVNYLMHRVEGRWRIYDVTVDAISVIANYRNQFNRVINNDGYGKLVADLKAKQQQLQAYMDHPTAAVDPQ
jgi:phospholipid transport system substrate-binding protein